MTASFNLADRPWIPCIHLDGSVRVLSLADALAHTHEIRELHDDSPLVMVALHRLLLAILHRNFGPASINEWRRLWGAGKFDRKALDAYFAKWRDRFDLFHPERPFAQVAQLQGEERGAQSLALELASGNNATLFDHTLDEQEATIDASTAATRLVAHQCYALGGRVRGAAASAQSAPLASVAAILLSGASLFETLMLNLVLYGARETAIPTTREDAPAWERETPMTGGARTPLGHLDYLTWQPRRLRLLASAEGRAIGVRQVIFGGEGDRLDPSINLLEPMAAYRKDEARGMVGLRFRADRALWRDSLALLRVGRQDAASPAAVRFSARLVKEGIVGPEARLSLRAFGVTTERGKIAKILLWRHERMPLPTAFLREEALVEQLNDALRRAEDTADGLYQALFLMGQLLLAPGSDDPQARKPLPQDVRQIVTASGALQHYWSRLEQPFHELLLGLPVGVEAAQSRWRDRLRAAAHDAFDGARRLFGSGARGLKATARAERELSFQLAKRLPRDHPADAEQAQETT